MGVIITMAESVPGREIAEVVGTARGNVVRARHVGNDILASLRTIVGGEISEYSKLMAEARDQSLDRLARHAEEMGADAVICLRITTSTVMQGAAEILAYGTAVRLR